MNHHFSSEDITRWILGDRTGVAAHFENCVDCQAKVAAETQALLHFRESAQAWSDAELSAGRTRSWKAAAQARLRFRNASLALAMCLAAFFAVLVSRPQPSRIEGTVTDAALLKQVNSELSRSVPGPMEPLMKLVSWDGADRNKGTER